MRDQDGKCFFCDKPMHMHGSKHSKRKGKLDSMCTRERIIPGARGGTYAYDNLVGACYECNNLRATIPFNVFRAYAKSPRRDYWINAWKSRKAFYRECAGRANTMRTFVYI